jgi:hypothetical protein
LGDPNSLPEDLLSCILLPFELLSAQYLK